MGRRNIAASHDSIVLYPCFLRAASQGSLPLVSYHLQNRQTHLNHKSPLNTTLRLTNWLAITFFGLSVVVIALSNPSTSVLAAFNLIPFGLALLANRVDSRRSAIWAAVVANGLWAALYIGVALIVLLGLGGTLIAVPFVLVIAIPCMLNSATSWRSLHAGG